MGCELDGRPGETKTEPIPPPSSSGTERGTVCNIPYTDTLDNSTATERSDLTLTQQTDCKMASANDDLRASLDNNQNIRSAREPVESIDSTVHVTDDKTEVCLNNDTTQERTEHISRDMQVLTERQSPSSLKDDSAGSEQSVSDEQIVSSDLNAGSERNVYIEPNVCIEPNALNDSNVSNGSNVSGEQSASKDPLCDIHVRAEILKNLEILKDRLETCTDIPSILLDVSLNCLKPSTIEYMSYHLDNESDILSSDDRCKDYRGMAEWIGLEPIFIKYISRSSHLLKTREVLSKWLTLEVEPVPTLKNLRKCLVDIDRPDVLEDMSIKIARDAVSWQMTEFEAQTQRPASAVDTSWQLTRHDVVTGKQTFYTCCLVYADEDEGMVQIFTKLYKSVYSGASFFLPQFDLKQGKFIYDTTAQVIEERCGGKVIFLISEYFFASNVCQFAVNFCKEMESSTGQGNLIPFKLTKKYEHVPRVLRGIVGFCWFRKASRKRLWSMLTDSLLGGKMTEREIEEVKERMEEVIERDSEYYLSDPPYDEDTPQPGEPISVYDPPPEDDDPFARHFNPDESESLSKKSNLTRIRHYVRKKIVRRVFGSDRQRRPGPPPSTAHQSPIV